LFYTVLGGTAGTSINTTHNANYDLFKNFQPGSWSSVEAGSYTWGFIFSNGMQSTFPKTANIWALAVRSGDVGASPVPVPGALVLMGPALLGLLGVKRSRRRA